MLKHEILLFQMLYCPLKLTAIGFLLTKCSRSLTLSPPVVEARLEILKKKIEGYIVSRYKRAYKKTCLKLLHAPKNVYETALPKNFQFSLNKTKRAGFFSSF